MSDHLHDEEAIFHVARRLPPEQRAVYLKQVCGNDRALPVRVEALLAAHEEAGFLEVPVVDAAATIDQPITECAGMVIGRYKLLQKIGEGGFGVVFMAEQKSPVVRRVALKVIKPGMDSHAVVARFEAERQALALMDHPNVAHILDGGVTGSGRPYFVMELVIGMPITEYCDRNDLPTEDRLRLFIDVCKAVQHAHQKGIIHRDLKPSNILVTLHDGKPVPRVIDFGVSKALHQRLTEKTLFTAFGQMIGTPQYMSPEQAEMSGLDVDTRSDVYSLGVLLYELLTGTTPLEAASLRGVGYAEVQRIIKETEPPRPSVRLSASGEKLTAIAKHRSIDPKALHRLIRGDLDWIVMKALEKERSRRYEHASDLSDDVERFLDREAVEAHPPSVLYRFRKFARRNKYAASLLTIVLTAVLLATLGTTIGMLHATHHAAVAEQRAYFADMNVAMQAWEESNVGRVGEILIRYQESEIRGFEWYYLWQLYQDTDAIDRIMVGDKAHKLSFSPNGEQLAVAYVHGVVELFDAGTPQKDAGTPQATRTFACRRAEFYPFLAFSNDGVRLARPDSDPGTVVIEDLKNEGVQKRITNPGTVREVAFSPTDDVLAIAAGRSVMLWSLDRETIIHPLEHQDEVWSLAFSSDGTVLVSGTDSGMIEFWDPIDGERLRSVAPPPSNLSVTRLQRVWSLAFSGEGDLLAAGVGDWTVRLYDPRIADKPLVATLFAHSDEVRSVSFSPTERILASASRDGTVKLWQLDTFKELKTLRGYSFSGHSCAFSPTGCTLAFGGVDYFVLLWDMNRECRDTIDTATEAENRVKHLHDMVFTPDGERAVLFSESDRRSVRVLNTACGREEFFLREPGTVQAIAVSGDGRIAVGGDGFLSLWDIRRTKKIAARPIEGPSVTALAFNDQDGTLIMGFEDGAIGLWMSGNLTDDQPIWLSGSRHQGAVTCLAVSHWGDILASGSEDHRVMTWDLRTHRFKESLDEHRDRVLCLAFSPTANLLASGAQEHDKALCIWDLSVTSPRAEVIMSARTVYSLVFSPHGNILFAAHGDNTIRLWDVASGQQRLRLRGHTYAVHSLGLASDGCLLLSGDRYGTIRLWRAAYPERMDKTAR
jgi:eukaryotic-like serine/threonine-protein kinase